MDTLTVWTFRTPNAAAPALLRLGELAFEADVTLDDAALLTWPEGRRKPSFRRLGGLGARGALWGGFWDVLFGLIFLVPLASPKFGAAAGAFAGSLAGLGFPEDFVDRVRDVVVPGTSALFVLSSGAAANRLADDVGAAGLLRCDLAPEQARRLQAALGEETPRPLR